MSAPQKPGKLKHGVVKQVISGDTIVIRGYPVHGPPPEITIRLCNIIAPKLERRSSVDSNGKTKDEPYAWKAREFLREKLIGQDVAFSYTTEKSQRLNKPENLGKVWLGKDETGEDIIKTLVKEGLVSVKKDAHNQTSEHLELIKSESHAKASKLGKWADPSAADAVRNITWNIDDPRKLVEKFGKKPIKAIIDGVRDGSTVRAFLLPDFYYITLMISGVRCPGMVRDSTIDGEPYAKEAKYFVESRLLHREVEIILESTNNNNFIGSIIHPKGNIAEILLSQGFAKCQDWSIGNTRSGAEKLYLAEKAAKEARLRLWKDYKPSGPQIEFTGTVVEIVNADALIIRTQNGENKKVFLSSIRPPSRDKKPTEDTAVRSKDFRPLYDIPWMLEAREFLREKFIRKNVKVVVDYTQPARDNFPEKLCCTVTCSKTNIAEALVSKGLARVIKHRQNDDQRSSHYNFLQVAESKAEKSGHGLHAKKDIPVHRLVDLSNDPSKPKAFLTSLKRAQGIKAVVEFVTSGSRLKLFLPKEDQLITFVLAGIRTPRCQRTLPSGSVIKADEYGEKALSFTREHCFQRDVEIKIENTETKGSGFIGWLTVNDVNMSIALVEEGLAEVVTFSDSGELTKTLKAAEERAKAKKLNIWKNRVEVQVESEKIQNEKEVLERKIDYQEVVISEVTDELHFYAQSVEQGSMLENMLLQLRQELASNPPLPGAYKPTRGDWAVAKFTGDDQWYRVKTEKVSGSNVSVFYVDYGNREIVNVTRVADIPSRFTTDKPYAHEYQLACINLPDDNDDKKEAVKAFKEEVVDKILLLNIEYKISSTLSAVTLADSVTNDDIAKTLIAEGLLLVQKNRDKRLVKLVEEYTKAEEDAKRNHLNIFRYGDIRRGDDDEKEFGA